MRKNIKILADVFMNFKKGIKTDIQSVNNPFKYIIRFMLGIIGFCTLMLLHTNDSINASMLSQAVSSILKFSFGFYIAYRFIWAVGERIL